MSNQQKMKCEKCKTPLEHNTTSYFDENTNHEMGEIEVKVCKHCNKIYVEKQIIDYAIIG